MVPNSITDESRTSEALIADLKHMERSRCVACQAAVCHHQVLMSIALGFKSQPHCLNCLAGVLQSSAASLRNSVFDYIRRRECYHAAWQWANRTEGFRTESLPPCLLVFGPPGGVQSAPVNSSAEETAPHKVTVEPPLFADAEWDAGDMACGDLVLQLRLRLQVMPARQILRLCARDAGAPEDLPAWCRLTGHTLLRAEHPTYWIKRKD